MEEYHNRNNDMYLSDWYDNYLMRYVGAISKPKYSITRQRKYNEILLSWYENWDGYMERVNN